MLNTGEFINLRLYLCSISIAMFLTTVFIPHLVERRPNHCFQTSPSSEQSSVKLFVVGFALHRTGLQSNTMCFSKVTGLNFLNLATSKIGQEKQNGMI